MMISITTVLQMHIQYIFKYKCRNRWTPLFSYERFINFWLRFFDTRRETQFLKTFRNYIMLTISNAVRHMMSKISVGRDLQNSNFEIPQWQRTLLSACMGQSQFLNWLFFQNPQILNTSLLGMPSSTLQSHFLSGIYYDNDDCHILSARA